MLRQRPEKLFDNENHREPLNSFASPEESRNPPRLILIAHVNILEGMKSLEGWKRSWNSLSGDFHAIRKETARPPSDLIVHSLFPLSKGLNAGAAAIVNKKNLKGKHRRELKYSIFIRSGVKDQ